MRRSRALFRRPNLVFGLLMLVGLACGLGGSGGEEQESLADELQQGFKLRTVRG